MKLVIFLVGLVLFLATLQSANGLAQSNAPDHLEPIVDWVFNDCPYDSLVRTMLVADSNPIAAMIVKPSFLPEYALIMRKSSPTGSKVASYEIELAQASKPIWHHKELEDGSSVTDCRRDVLINRTVLAIDSAVLADLIETWNEVLFRTSKSEDLDRVLDGIVYDFMIHRGPSGCTHSPQTGLPHLMVECGQTLLDYVKSEEGKRQRSLQRIQEVVAMIGDAIRTTTDE